jgi:hypothetical protein
MLRIVSAVTFFESPLIEELRKSLSKLNILEKVNLVNYGVKSEDFSVDEFSKAIEGADVLIIEPEKFVLGSPVLCKPDSSLKFVQTIYAGCEYITDKSANVVCSLYET